MSTRELPLAEPKDVPSQNPEMTKEQAKDFFGHLFRGKHHIPSDVKPFGRGWKVNAHASLGTFDFNDLTRLVFLCHDRCVRGEIVQGGPGRVGIAIWQRGGREGAGYYRHPTIDQALEQWRKGNPELDVVFPPKHVDCDCMECRPWTT